MAQMHSIEITAPDGSRTVWACNASHEGVFCREPHECAYRQLEGTCQTPVFETRDQFRRYLRRHYEVTGRETARFFDDLA